MREITFGQYYPQESIVHRLDPRIKLILSTAYIVMIFFINTFTAYGIVFLFVLLLTALSRIPLPKVLKSVRPMLFIIFFTATITIFIGGGVGQELPLFSWWVIKLYKSAIFAALKLALRLTLLVMGPSILTFTTTPVELTDALERLLKPLAMLRIPVHVLCLIMSIALSLIPSLTKKTDNIVNAQRARCADFDSGNIFKKAKAMLPVLIPLLVSAFLVADELAYAMDSRCYRGSKGRTRMKIMKLRASDLIAAVFFAAVFFAILLVRYQWFGLSAYIGFLV